MTLITGAAGFPLLSAVKLGAAVALGTKAVRRVKGRVASLFALCCAALLVLQPAATDRMPAMFIALDCGHKTP
jgi:hypothetical protein